MTPDSELQSQLTKLRAIDPMEIVGRAGYVADLIEELIEARKFQVVCPNCQTSKHLLYSSAGWWCNGCGGGELQKERQIESLKQQLESGRLCCRSLEMALDRMRSVAK